MITRREAVILTAGSLGCGLLGLAGCNSREPLADTDLSIDPITPPNRSDQLLHLAEHVHPLTKWAGRELFTFTNAMKESELRSLGQGLEMPEFADGQARPEMIKSIHTEIVWQSSSIFTYPVKSIENIDYHGIVSWCAKNVGIDSTTRSFTSTFDLEQAIVKRQFVELWDKLSEQQRLELLGKIDTGNLIADRAAIAAMSGSVALAALSGTVYLTGFTFYTTMSVVIATVASWFGVTLPFVAYTTASSTVAVLAGPIGWAIAAVLMGAAVAWTGRSNVKKTTAAVMQLHAIKAGALYCNHEM
ncbi:MAG: hypothetical protein RLY14_3217 [Planctomycetota bacterium]|jgi:uncharacterized protein YaaW (UPF0174 family)